MVVGGIKFWAITSKCAAVVYVDCIAGFRLAAAFSFLSDFNIERLVKGEGHSGQKGEEGIESHYKIIHCF